MCMITEMTVKGCGKIIEMTVKGGGKITEITVNGYGKSTINEVTVCEYIC